MNRRELMQAAIGVAGCAALPADGVSESFEVNRCNQWGRWSAITPSQDRIVCYTTSSTWCGWIQDQTGHIQWFMDGKPITKQEYDDWLAGKRYNT